jgi:hypothetical protein
MSHELPEPTRPTPPRQYSYGGNTQADRIQPQNLADILERVLDKGIVIAGDIQINLLEIELLTIKIRLVVASVDRAEEMGLDWWRTDPMFSSSARNAEQENAELRRRIEELEGRSDGDGRVLEDEDEDEKQDEKQGRRR